LCWTRRNQVLRFAQDDNSIFSPVLSLCSASYLFLSASFICALVIDDPLGVQLFDKGNHIGANFPWRREDELLLELLNNLQ